MNEALRGRRLRVALIVDSHMSSKYVYQLAQWGQRQSNLEISHLIIQKLPAETPQGPLGRVTGRIKKLSVRHLARRILSRLVWRLETKKLSGDRIHRDHLTEYNLLEFVKSTIVVEPLISKSRFVYRYRESDILEIKSQDFDVLIRCGSGILHGEILRAARLGIISLHHADNRINRGGPPAFWEVYQRQDSTGFTIQHLTEELDGGNVLFRGRLPTRRTWLLNQAALYAKSNYYLMRVLDKIAETSELPATRDSYPYYNRLYKDPSARVLLNYLLTSVSELVSVRINDKYVKKYPRWGVAFSYCDWRNLVMWRGIKIKNPPNHFLADPFVVHFEDTDYCFVEDYDFGISRGYITVYKLLEHTAEKIGDALVEPFHMSYPYVFEYQSKYYMCPETSENRDVRVYECVEFPLKWQLRQVLMSDISAADTTIFERDGVWWLLTNLDSINVGDHCSELSLFFADHPLSDQWTPHPKNPIYVDSLKARNGGILREGDSIYRVSQRQGFDRYGSGFSINRILELSKTDYKEEALFAVEPNFSENLIGAHHIHSNGRITVFDYLEKTRIDR